MCEMLKQAALFGQKSVQHRFAVMLVTRPDDVMVGARDDADRIELDKSELTHDRQDVRFSDRGVANPCASSQSRRASRLFILSGNDQSLRGQ